MVRCLASPVSTAIEPPPLSLLSPSSSLDCSTIVTKPILQRVYEDLVEKSSSPVPGGSQVGELWDPDHHLHFINAFEMPRWHYSQERKVFVRSVPPPPHPSPFFLGGGNPGLGGLNFRPEQPGNQPLREHPSPKPCFCKIGTILSSRSSSGMRTFLHPPLLVEIERIISRYDGPISDMYIHIYNPPVFLLN